MKVLCQGSLGWFRAISFIWLVNLANAPQLEHLSVPSVCIGQHLQLPWIYDLSSATAGNITWTFDQSEENSSVPIILATFDVADGTFQIDPVAMPRYKVRLFHMREQGYTAGIEISNVDEKDAGSYGVIIHIDKPKYYGMTDVVNVSVVDVKSNKVVPTDKPIICSNETKSTKLSWKVLNPRLPKDKVCQRPTWTEWRRNGTAIARRYTIDGLATVVPGVGLDSRLRDQWGSPFTIIIEPTLGNDAGNYTVTVRFGSFSTSSLGIFLQVSRLMNISEVADIRTCIGTDAVFNWTFYPGTDCNNVINTVDNIVLTKIFRGSKEAIYIEFINGPFNLHAPRVEQYNESNAGFIIHNVNESDTAIYEVAVKFMNRNNLTTTTKLTVETPLTPKITSDPGTLLEMCEGESFILSWTFHYPDRNNSCPSYTTVISRNWYINETLVFSQNTPTTTKERSSTTRKETPTQKKVTATGITPNTKAATPEITNPKDTTPETITHKEEPTQEKVTITGDLTLQPTTGESMIRKEASPEATPLPMEPTTIGANQVTSGQRGRRFVLAQPNSATFSFEMRFQALLAVHGVKLEDRGSYHVNVSFESCSRKIIYVISNRTSLVVRKAPAVSLHGKGQSAQNMRICMDEILQLTWDLKLYDCLRPFIISWHLRHADKTEEEIGLSQDGCENFRAKFAKRVNVTDRVSLTIHSLTTDDSGTYIVRLSYPTDQSVVGSERKDLKGAVFSESSINIIVDDSSTCGLGAKGNLGFSGPAGKPGTRGSPGDRGFSGLTGPPGSTGLRGEAGLEGKEGQPGFPGVKGEPGVPASGADGSRGSFGTPGGQGEKGSLGQPGLPGPSELNGALGKDGMMDKAGKSVKQCALNTQAVLATEIFWILVLHMQRP